jgi:putative ABC transport system permease protein
MVALYNSMEQRRRQIAVLRVLGCSRPRIFGLVLTESAILGILGAAGGLLLSLVAGAIVAAIMRERLGLIITPAYTPDWVIAVLVGAVVLSALAGTVPAVMAYRTSVVKNLKPIG